MTAPCGSPPTVWTSFSYLGPGSSHGCTRKLGHEGKHRNKVITWDHEWPPMRILKTRRQLTKLTKGSR
jgi:hypothetical protein